MVATLQSTRLSIEWQPGLLDNTPLVLSCAGFESYGNIDELVWKMGLCPELREKQKSVLESSS
jgi:hypothetical protein